MKKYWLLALLIIAIMGGLLFASVHHETATYDETAHLAAGVSYVQEHKYYLNPEHPPFIKYLAGLSATWFGKAKFPVASPAWQYGVNNQYELGDELLFNSGQHNAEQLLFWGRFPLILLALFFAYLVFAWTKREYGKKAAFLALIFFAFSPTILANARYITTDVAAALGFFLGLIAFLHFLKKPTWLNMLWAGLALGLGLLTKFSLLLLPPIFVVLALSWFLWQKKWDWWIVLKTALIFCISLVTIWVCYSGVMYKEPSDRQLVDTQALLTNSKSTLEKKLVIHLISHKVQQPFAKYLTGVILANDRLESGSPVYLLGKHYPTGVPQYFPLLYLYKEALPFHILTLMAIAYAALIWRKKKGSFTDRVRFTSFALFLVITVYWLVSLRSQLNIGIRHILPLLPLTYILVAAQISRWWERTSIKTSILVALLVWLVGGTILSYPNFLSFYNELAGGTTNGYKVAVDSNYDWGQDVPALVDYVNSHHIEKLGFDYFGTASLNYYLGDKVERWNTLKPEYHGWFAISASKYSEFLGGLTPSSPTNGVHYAWLLGKTPVARAGKSIFIYYLP